jgi:hypothetical protein
MYEQKCIGCKRKHNLNVPLRPISIKDITENVINLKYACSCGCNFERTIERNSNTGMSENIILASEKEMSDIIKNRKPLGLFFRHDSETSLYIGVDNSHGDAFTEEFEKLEDCIDWLGK